MPPSALTEEISEPVSTLPVARQTAAGYVP